MVATSQTPENPTEQLGVAGYKESSGYITEEFLRELQGIKGVRTYRQMKDNDPTVGAVLKAITLLIRSAEWMVELPDEDNDLTAEGRDVDGEDAKMFLESVLFDDMDHTFEDFISEVLTMLPFGWSYFEVVYKRRLGLDQADITRRSQYNDGLIGIRRLALRPQETLFKWQIERNGDVIAMEQCDPNSGGVYAIPVEKALHFTAEPNKGSPEGRSILRNAYKPWYYLQNVENIEAIAIERELAGLPVIYVPSEVLTKAENGDVGAKRLRDSYVDAVRNVKRNEQGGMVLPSDPYRNADGTYTSTPKVKFELVTSGGTRAIDTDKAKTGYKTDIARSVLAQFIMLGVQQRGSFGLSSNETDLFMEAIGSLLDNIATTINRCLIPTLWSLNGFSPNSMPYVKAGDISPTNLDEIGTFIERLTRAGAPLFPDEELEAFLRDQAGLPGRSQEDGNLEDASLIAGEPTDGSTDQ